MSLLSGWRRSLNSNGRNAKRLNGTNIWTSNGVGDWRQRGDGTVSLDVAENKIWDATHFFTEHFRPQTGEIEYECIGKNGFKRSKEKF